MKDLLYSSLTTFLSGSSCFYKCEDTACSCTCLTLHLIRGMTQIPWCLAVFPWQILCSDSTTSSTERLCCELYPYYSALFHHCVFSQTTFPHGKTKYLLQHPNNLLHQLSLLILSTDTTDGDKTFLRALRDVVHWLWFVHSHHHWGTHRVQTCPATNQEEIQDEVLAPYQSGTCSEETLWKLCGWLRKPGQEQGIKWSESTDSWHLNGDSGSWSLKRLT